MAIRPVDEYPAQTLDSDPGFPHGKARNEVVPGDGVGTPLEEDWVNDLWGWQQALLDEGGVTPSGAPDEVGASDYVDAMDAVIDAAIAAEIDPLTDIVEGNADIDPKPSRAIVIQGFAFKTFIKTGAADPGVAAVAASGTGWRLSLSHNNLLAALPLSRLLPFGAEVTLIQLLLHAGTHTAGGRFSVHAVQLDFATSAVSAHAESGAVVTSGTGLQVRALSGSPLLTIGTSSSHYLVYDPNDLTAGADLIEGVRIVYNDPGPRNW